MFAALYTKAMQWAKHRYAVYWLALVSFTESAFFIVPPDVMLAPMSLAKPDKAWHYAALTTVMSVLGGVLGYEIGVFAFDKIAPWLLDSHYAAAFEMTQRWFSDWGFWAILVAGFTPIPYKIFTISAGVAGMALIPFILGSLIARGARFFLVAGLMRWGGAPFEAKLKQWMDRLGWSFIAVIVVVFTVMKVF